MGEPHVSVRFSGAFTCHRDYAPCGVGLHSWSCFSLHHCTCCFHLLPVISSWADLSSTRVPAQAWELNGRRPGVATGLLAPISEHFMGVDTCLGSVTLSNMLMAPILYILCMKMHSMVLIMLQDGHLCPSHITSTYVCVHGSENRSPTILLDVHQ